MAMAHRPTRELSRALGIDGSRPGPDRLPKPVVVITDKLPAREHHGWRYVRLVPAGGSTSPSGHHQA